MALEVGKAFPEFSLLNQDGQMVTLDDFVGKWLVIYVYPKDDTPGCTIQGKSFTATKQEFDDANIAVLGVSADDQHQCPRRQCRERYAGAARRRHRPQDRPAPCLSQERGFVSQATLPNASGADEHHALRPPECARDQTCRAVADRLVNG